MDLREISEFFRDAAIYIITFLIIAVVLIFIVSFQPVAGNSMVSTLEEGDVVLVSKFSYSFVKIKRNDVVVLKKDGKSYVKRVIGLPGENIKFLKNVFYINDEPFTENYLDKDIITSGFTMDDICKVSNVECDNGKIPENYYLVLGDNREQSEDSRNFGLVSKKDIKGKVFFRVWPLNKIGNVK